jgi:hypothetical protein
MPELTAFEDAFCAALAGQPMALALWRPPHGEAPGLSVYRNTVAKGSVDALAATYRTVVQLVGEDWFRGAAVAYVTARPPTKPSLLDYGADFPDWLEEFPPAQDTPYLARVAHIDHLWREAYFAPDAAPLAADAFAALEASEFGSLHIRLHPSARLAAFDQNIVSLWLAHQAPTPALDGFELVDTPERVLIVRPALEVDARILDGAAFAFLASCAAGDSLQAAAERALATDPRADFPRIIATGLEAGVFAALAPSQEE